MTHLEFTPTDEQRANLRRLTSLVMNRPAYTIPQGAVRTEIKEVSHDA